MLKNKTNLIVILLGIFATILMILKYLTSGCIGRGGAVICGKETMIPITILMIVFLSPLYKLIKDYIKRKK